LEELGIPFEIVGESVAGTVGESTGG